jgi:hypothetical protein
MRKIKLKNEYSITCPFLWGEGGRGGGGIATFFEKNDYFGYISNLIFVW